MAVVFNRSYLNRTPNKSIRNASNGKALVGVVLHETAGSGTLEWNLKDSVRASFNYLILRNGTIYHYVDEKQYIAWHAGIASKWEIGGKLYKNGMLNQSFIGVEVEGPNDATPITTAQQISLVALIQYFKTEYGIGIVYDNYPEHWQVAPSHKTDARGYSGRYVVELAAAGSVTIPALPPDLQVIGVPLGVTEAQFRRALQRHGDPLTNSEILHILYLCAALEIDPAFVLSLWKHEGGSPFGSSELQRQSKSPLNLRAAPGEWRRTVPFNGSRWLAYQSFQIGLMAGIIHLKDHYGAAGLLTVRKIIEVFAPAGDGNMVDSYVNSVLEDIAYIRTH